MATLPGPSMSNGVSVRGLMTANGVMNVFTNGATGQQVVFTANQTPYLPDMVCPAGTTAGANNDCVSSGSASAPPFRQSSRLAFDEYATSMFNQPSQTSYPEVTAAQRQVMAERGPLPRGAKSAYSAMF